MKYGMKKNLYSLGKKCRHCGKPIVDASTTGSCHHCRMTIDQRGKGNNRFGKRYSDEEKQHFAEKTRENWTKDEYRKKVIDGATGLKRSDEFRKGQSKRTAASYNKIEGLREKRGKVFSECWKNGKNHFHSKPSVKSREEKEIFDYLNSLGKYEISDKEIQLKDGSFKSPDIVVNRKVIVEFYGDYYHANPAIHPNDEFIVKKGMSAKEVRTLDQIRENMFRESGYDVIVIWQRDYRQNKEFVLAKMVKDIDNFIERKI